MALRRCVLTMLAFACSILVGATAMRGADFAIETHVFQGGQPQPVAENLTVFAGSMIYDFSLSDPPRTTVFDPEARVFRLADPQSQVLTTLTADELLQFVAAEQAQAQQSRSALVRFAAAPSFDEQYDPSSGELRLTSPFWDYEVQTIAPPDRTQLQRYLQFAHWYTQLNALFRPLPPGVRLQLNQSLTTHQRLPVRVVARLKRDGDLLMEQESRHKMIWTLTEREQQPVRQWQQQHPGFRRLSVREYLATYH